MMSWAVTHIVRGQPVGIISGFGYGGDPCLSLSALTIDNLTDQEIAYIARWFVEHSAELYAIHTGAECHYHPQFISDEQLSLIINGTLASDKYKQRAASELARRHNGGAWVNPYVEYKRKQRGKKPGYVYLAYSETDHYKIGKSIGPEDRIAVFDTQMPIEVSMLHSFEADDMSTAEAMLHRQFDDKQVKGEWFDLDPVDIEFIKSIEVYTDGQFIGADDGAIQFPMGR